MQLYKTRDVKKVSLYSFDSSSAAKYTHNGSVKIINQLSDGGTQNELLYNLAQI